VDPGRNQVDDTDSLGVRAGDPAAEVEILEVEEVARVQTGPPEQFGVHGQNGA
jgi:hypothetical protein